MRHIYCRTFSRVFESLNLRKIFAILVAFFGVFLVVSNGEIIEPNIGDLLMIFDGFLWAIYTVLGKIMLKVYRAEHLTAYAFALGTLMLSPFGGGYCKNI